MKLASGAIPAVAAAALLRFALAALDAPRVERQQDAGRQSDQRDHSDKGTDGNHTIFRLRHEQGCDRCDDHGQRADPFARANTTTDPVAIIDAPTIIGITIAGPPGSGIPRAMTTPPEITSGTRPTTTAENFAWATDTLCSL